MGTKKRKRHKAHWPTMPGLHVLCCKKTMINLITFSFSFLLKFDSCGWGDLNCEYLKWKHRKQLTN